MSFTVPGPDIEFWIKDAQPGGWRIKQLTIVATKHWGEKREREKENIQPTKKNSVVKTI